LTENDIENIMEIQSMTAKQENIITNIIVFIAVIVSSAIIISYIIERR